MPTGFIHTTLLELVKHQNIIIDIRMIETTPSVFQSFVFHGHLSSLFLLKILQFKIQFSDLTLQKLLRLV
jgi:hypothetical protein